MADEKELLGSDYVYAINELSQQTTQMGGGFYQLSNDSAYEDQYPNAINDFVKTEGVKKIAEKAEVDPENIKSPFVISDDTISDIDGIISSADPLNMSDSELTSLRNDVDNIVGGISIPTPDQLTTFINSYSKFVAAASLENVSFPTNFREIQLVSTDTSLDSFLNRTGIRKLDTIKINTLVYPFITERHSVPSPLQATLTGTTGSNGDTTINYVSIDKIVGVGGISVGSVLLVTNNAKDISDLKQQKNEIEWMSEDSKTIRLKKELLFDLTSECMVRIYQYTANKVLSPGDTIKIPK